MFKCLNCSKEKAVSYKTFNKYCSNSCQGEYKFLNETLPKFHKGEISTMRTLNKCLSQVHGYKCSICSNEGMYNNKPLSLQVDHINGDATNNMPDNLRLLCPNCHAQTDTYSAKNKGKSTRVRVRYSTN